MVGRKSKNPGAGMCRKFVAFYKGGETAKSIGRRHGMNESAVRRYMLEYIEMIGAEEADRIRPAWEVEVKELSKRHNGEMAMIRKLVRMRYPGEGHDSWAKRMEAKGIEV